MRLGNSLKIDASRTGTTTTVREVIKVEIQFANSYYNNASQVTAHAGSITFNNNTTTPIVTWTGRARSLQLYMTKGCCIEKVWVTIRYFDGNDCVAHPVFNPVDQSDFHTATKQVTITSPTPGADIYYCLNNRNPGASYTKYTGPITISGTTFIRAYCKKGDVAGSEDSCRIVKSTTNFQVKDKAFFKNKKYTWVDVKGVRGTKGATITSDMTEEATTTEQIMALLKAVYTDATIPGQVYMNVGEEASYAGYKTNPRDQQHGFWTANRQNEITNQWGINPLSQDPVAGYTALLVKVRDDYVKEDYDAGIFRHGDKTATTYSDANNYAVYRAISESYESVQMLYGTRVGFDSSKGWPDEGYNPGTLYLYTGKLNRFFIISKGDALWGSGFPLLGLYEELATDAAYVPSDENFMSVYASFSDGRRFPVTHDCPSVVPATGHMMQMDSEGQAYQMNNLTFFIPDYRLKYWEKSAQGLEWPIDEYVDWSWCPNRNVSGTIGLQMYHGRHLPTSSLYTVKLTATVTPTATEHVLSATPTWESTLDGLSPATGIAQEYLLYVVTTDDEGNETLTPLNGGNTLTTNSFSYNVPQHETGYYITYIVKARLQGSDMDYVLSNKATVYIPGYEETRYGVLHIGESHLSEYKIDKQVNAYCNYVQFVNDPAFPLMHQQLATGTQMKIHRYDHEQSDMGVIATVTITSKTARSGGGYDYQYSIQMADATQSEANASRYPATTGSFTAGSDGMVSFGNLYIADQFSDSTATNQHPTRYYYQLKMLDAENHAIESNLPQVDVHKTDLDVTGTTFTLADIQDDTEHDLSLERQLNLSVIVGNDAS